MPRSDQGFALMVIVAVASSAAVTLERAQRSTCGLAEAIAWLKHVSPAAVRPMSRTDRSRHRVSAAMAEVAPMIRTR